VTKRCVLFSLKCTRSRIRGLGPLRKGGNGKGREKKEGKEKKGKERERKGGRERKEGEREREKPQPPNPQLKLRPWQSRYRQTEKRSQLPGFLLINFTSP